MSKTTEQLEVAVAEVIVNRSAAGGQPTARQRATLDRAFATVLKIIAPRIRHFIKRYGLSGHWDDAEQVCAIAVHRAIDAYDPAKAMFTTFVNWQIRGELQGLRFRLMDDQRPSAKKVEATTVSLHGSETGPNGEARSLEALLVDENALPDTEAGASDYLTGLTQRALMDEYMRHQRSVGMAQLKRKARAVRSVAPRACAGDDLPKYIHVRQPQANQRDVRKLEDWIARDREIVATCLFAADRHGGADDERVREMGLTRERVRQITRRAARVMSELAAGNARFSASVPETPWPPDGEESAGAGICPGEAGGDRDIRVTIPEDREDAMIGSGAALRVGPGSHMSH